MRAVANGCGHENNDQRTQLYPQTPKVKREPFATHSGTKNYRKWLCNTHLHLLSFDFSFGIPHFSLLFYWNLYFLFTFLLKSLLSLYFSIEISAFSLLFDWNLYFLFTLLLKSLLSLYFSIEISTFSLLFYWNLYFLFTFLLKSLLSLYFSVKISTFSLLFYWNLYFLFPFLLKSLLSLYFSIEASTFSLLFYWNLYFLSIFLLGPLRTCAPAPHLHQRYIASPNVTTHHMCACTTSAPASHCEKQSRLASPNVTTHTKKIKKLCPELDGHTPKPRRDRAETAPHKASHTTSFCNPAHSDLLWKHRDSHLVPCLPRKLQPLDWDASWLSYSMQKFQRKTLPRIRRVTRQTRAETAPRPCRHRAAHRVSHH